MLDYDRWYCGHRHINKVNGKIVLISNIIVMSGREYHDLKFCYMPKDFSTTEI